MKQVLESNEIYELAHHTGMTRFRGCQCFRDCSCNEDFKRQPYDYYTVKKLFKKIKTIPYNTIEEARERIDFLIELHKNLTHHPPKQ